MSVDEGALVVTVAGERVVLLPERAMYWPRHSMLLLADPHFGKAATFRSHGLPVPSGTTDEALARLTRALERSGADRIVILGDFLHAREGRAPGTLDAVARWRASHAGVDVLLVRGNHDRRAGDPPNELRVRCTDPPHAAPPFVFSHHPALADGAYVLAGHLHPGVRLHGAGGARARLPCFVFGTRAGVLPAFGDFTGLALSEPRPDEQVFVVAGESVMHVRGDVE